MTSSLISFIKVSINGFSVEDFLIENSKCSFLEPESCLSQITKSAYKIDSSGLRRSNGFITLGLTQSINQNVNQLVLVQELLFRKTCFLRLEAQSNVSKYHEIAVLLELQLYDFSCLSVNIGLKDSIKLLIIKSFSRMASISKLFDSRFFCWYYFCSKWTKLINFFPIILTYLDIQIHVPP